jgi:hopanoid biosynthesis associated RND transporter like protein HpnN
MNKLASILAENITFWVYKYSSLVIITFLVLAVLGFYYTSQNLGVNSNTSEMFDENLAFRHAQDHFKELFQLAEDNFVIVVSGPVPELVTEVADSITRQLQAHPDLFSSVFQPTGDSFFKQNQLLFLDTASLSNVVDQIAKARPMMSFMSENYSLKGIFAFLGLTTRYSSPAQLEGMSAMYQQMDSVLKENTSRNSAIMSWQLLMSSYPDSFDPRLSFIQVTPVLDYQKIRPAKLSIEAARKIVAPYNNQYTRVRITGKKAMTYEEMGSVMDGAIQASLLALVMVSLVLWLGLRSFRLIAASLITLLVGLIFTAGFSAWAVGQLNMISVAFAVLYIGLGVDYAIHLCLRYRELGLNGAAIEVALRGSIKHIAPALILSTLSTAIGFYAFVPTDFTGVSELGLIAGTGMFISLLVTLLLLPSLIWKMSGISSVRKKPKEHKGPNIEKYGQYIRYGTLFLSVVAMIILIRIEFDYDPINLRDPASESVATARELMGTGNLTPWSLNIITKDSSELDQLSSRLIALPEVERVVHIKSFLPNRQNIKLPLIDSLRNILQQVPEVPLEFEEIPLTDQLIAVDAFSSLLNSPKYSSMAIGDFGQQLLLFKDSLQTLEEDGQLKAILKLQTGLLSTLPFNINGLRKSISPGVVKYDDIPESIKQRWVSALGDYRIQIFPRQNLQSTQQMRDFANKVQQIAPQATGDLTVTLASGDTVIRAFKQALICAFSAISLMLLLYLRNLRDTLYILLPLVLAAVFTGALTVILGLDLNFANIIAIPVLLGLGVDNGVHIVHRARASFDVQPLLQTSTARAILFSSLTTLFSFGNLAFSPHRGTASMGILLTIGVVFILVATLLILPAFLNQGESIKD